MSGGVKREEGGLTNRESSGLKTPDLEGGKGVWGRAEKYPWTVRDGRSGTPLGKVDFLNSPPLFCCSFRTYRLLGVFNVRLKDVYRISMDKHPSPGLESSRRTFSGTGSFQFPFRLYLIPISSMTPLRTGGEAVVK